MNWEAVAAIGEVVGALGVIASLGYLAVQIRQNIEVGQVASTNQAQEQTWQARLAMVQDADSIRTLAKFTEQGLDNPENWENIVEGQLDFWSNPYMAAYIRSRRGPISERFAACIGKRIAQHRDEGQR